MLEELIFIDIGGKKKTHLEDNKPSRTGLREALFLFLAPILKVKC